MFTANIAGSAGSHLRSDLPHRDSYPHNSSHPNLLDIDGESYVAASAEEKRYLVKNCKKKTFIKAKLSDAFSTWISCPVFHFLGTLAGWLKPM